jgi:LPP20 lipoprotein
MGEKRIATALGLAVALALLAGCGEKELVKPDGTVAPIQTYVKEGKAPKWIIQRGAAFSGDKAVFYGVGNVAGVVNPSLKLKAAEGAARRDLAQQFQVYIAALQKQYLAETTAGALDRHSVEQHIEDVMKQVTEQTLVGTSIMDYWEHPDRNEAYALAKMDLGQFQEMVVKLQTNESKYKELDAKLKETIKKNAETLHRELADELNKKNQSQ